MKNKGGIIVGLISGILLIIGGATGGVGLFGTLPFIAAVLGLPAEIMMIINIALLILEFIASLGGIAVIIGVLLVAKERIGFGKLLIMLGAGMGLFGLILFGVAMFLSGYLTASLVPFILSSPGLLGAIMSIFARLMIKKPD
ncbi:MAG: hypothetical protein ACFFDP_00325 [Promethearchaeota archaeon]